MALLSTGGNTSLACQRDPGKAQATDAGHALPTNCCIDTTSELWNTIQNLALSASDKQTLYSCLATVNANWCDGLVSMFHNATAAEIAGYLNSLLGYCASNGNVITEDFRSCLLSAAMCNVTVYEGVTFPT